MNEKYFLECILSLGACFVFVFVQTEITKVHAVPCLCDCVSVTSYFFRKLFENRIHGEPIAV